MRLLRWSAAESRRSRGTLVFCLLSIAIGVASLTAVRTTIFGLRERLVGQGRSLLGADLSFSSRRALDSERAQQLTADLIERGAISADVVAFYSMVHGDGSSGARSGRLVRVRAVDEQYPLYGQIATSPPQRWHALGQGAAMIVDPAVLLELGVAVGDRLRLGAQEFEIVSALVKEPGSPVAAFSFAPSVFVSRDRVVDTGLVQRGSRIDYSRYFRLPADIDPEAWKQQHWDAAVDANITLRTSRESAASLQRFLRRLSYFLTLSALVTLLLGALGIGAAMRVFVREKLDNAAILRCLGARSRDLVTVYGAVALALGMLGSAAGVGLGALVPLVLSSMSRAIGGELLPVQLDIPVSLRACLHGALAGIGATVAFAVPPLRTVAAVAPLRTLRRDVEPVAIVRGWRGKLGGAVGGAAVLGFVVVVAAVESESLVVGAYFAGAIAVAVLVLVGLARLSRWAARRATAALGSYPVRQGIANLYRPGNQTVGVITTIGIGTLLIATILIVASSVRAAIAVEERSELPTAFLVDIQDDQVDELRRLLETAQVAQVSMAPMVAARIFGVNGRAVDRSQLERDATERTWQDRMRTREYFVSYRAALVASEQVTAGRFWDGPPAEPEASIDETLAANLGIGLGDRLDLDIQGIPFSARVTSYRRIRWQAMRPNAMIVLSPGAIEQAPKMYVASYRATDERVGRALQEQIVRRLPNVSVIDVTDAAETVRFVLGRLSAILGFLAGLTVLAGAVILAGAIASGRFARRRETMLLKVLGARRASLRTILAAEYVCLAVSGGLAGWLLAEAITRPALAQFFSTAAVVPYRAIGIVLIGVVALNLTVGMVVSRGVEKGVPLDVLRDE
jgi:putative ABC transport system permease protein